MNTSLRGSGRTTTALELIPQDSTYVCDELKSCAGIIRHIGRKDIDIVPTSYIEEEKFIGHRCPIFFDHAVRMNQFREIILQLVALTNNRWSPWGAEIMHVRFWNKDDQLMFIRLVRSGLKEQQAVEQMEMIGIQAMNKDFTNREGLVKQNEFKTNFPNYHYKRRW